MLQNNIWIGGRFMYYRPYLYTYPNYYIPTWPENQFPIDQMPIKTESLIDLNNKTTYPHVNTEKFTTSAKQFQEMIMQANLLVNRIIESQYFAQQIMEAAQLSKQNEVEKLISSTGITIKFDVKYTPDGMFITFIDKDSGTLKLGFHWAG